jgi:ribosomal peptide maturation radical SAM protein 1
MNVKEAERKIAELSLEGILEGGDVLLIVSPSIWTAAPIGGIHILQAACFQAGISTRVLYTNLHYSNLIGAKLHETIAFEDHYLLEERLFTTPAFGSPSQGEKIHKLLEPGWMPDHLWPKTKAIPKEVFPAVGSPHRELFRTVDWEHLESMTDQWLQTMVREIVKKGFRIVGCSTTHGGLASALALVNSVKKAAPSVITVLGGALCVAEMSEGILSLKSDIDYIFSGEGDITFPVLVKKILADHLPEKKIIYGKEVTDLDDSPLPDFQEYFNQKKSFQADDPPSGIGLTIPYETSRGCWYGRCTFCGLMEKTNIYRKKSPDKIIMELKQLTQRFGTNKVYITDNMVAPQYYKTLFPRLAVEIPTIRLLYEIKANMTLDQILILQKAGTILLQPGIESLSSSLLKRMEKGVTVRENIALLRYARSLNLELKWNLLFGFPGERSDEYEEMLRLLPLIRHLQPPAMMTPVRLWRYSRYHRSPGEYGITNFRPAEVHKEILPAHAEIEKLAYFFAGEYEAHSFDNTALLSALWKEYQAWHSLWKAYKVFPLDTLLPKLHITQEASDRFVLLDTRGIPGRPEKMVIDREQASLLLVDRPLERSTNKQVRWALENDLGILMDSWFIPLATAEASLLQEFERESKPEFPPLSQS